MNLAAAINHCIGFPLSIDKLGEPGYFSNNNEMNRWGKFGRAKKTKAKHGHASYRHKGDYGKAIDYSPHDLKQVQDMEQQVREIQNDRK